LLKSEDNDLTINEIKSAWKDFKDWIINLMKWMINLEKSFFLTIKWWGSIAYSSWTKRFEIKLYEGDDEWKSWKLENLLIVIEKLSEHLDSKNNYTENKNNLYYATNNTSSINSYLRSITNKVPTFTKEWMSRKNKY
jgi:hypothetical protein